MTTDDLLTQLGLNLGLPRLAFDAQGCACLQIDGQLRVNLERDDEARAINLWSTLGPLPPEGREALYARLLAGNLFGHGTGGATLALDAEHAELVLCRTVPADGTSAADFTALLERFVAAAEDWQQRIAGGAATAGSTDDGAAAAGMMRV